MASHSGESSPLFAPSELVREVADRLLDGKLSVGFAESCTGGRLSAMLTTFPGISEAFRGSVVAYADQVKVDLLGVSPDTLRRFGAVSREVALEMVIGARRVLRSDWAVSITGIAGPSGGTREKPVGLVFFGITGPGVEDVVERRLDGERTKIQQAAADHALSWLSHYLGGVRSL